MICPHCQQAMFKASADGQKLKAKTSMLVLHKAGGVEINCGGCGRGVLVPLQLAEGPFEMKKAEEPRFVARKR